MVSPATKRRAVKIVVAESRGRTAPACRALGLARSGYYSIKKVSVESRRLRREIVALSQAHPRYGYRRITALLRREGDRVNPKRVQRVRREEGIQVSKKQRRTKRGAYRQRRENGPLGPTKCGVGILSWTRRKPGRTFGF